MSMSQYGLSKKTADKTVVTYEGEPVIQEWLATGDKVAYLSNIAGHPNAFLNGDDVRTSRIVNYNPDNGFIETLNTVYVPR